MEFFLCGDEGGKGVNLSSVGNLDGAAGGEKGEGEKTLWPRTFGAF